jgi:hypothetical protein
MPTQRINDFVEFQSSILMRMSHQIDAREWPPLDEQRLSQFGLGIPFSMLPQPSLPQPKRASSLMPAQRMDDLVEFQSSIFMRMNDQIDGREWPSFDQKTFTVWALHLLVCVDPTKLATTKESSFVCGLAKNP